MTDTSAILAVLHSRYPSWLIGLELPVATTEELDLLADLQHLSREQILRRIINAALIRATPNWRQAQTQSAGSPSTPPSPSSGPTSSPENPRQRRR